MLLGTKLAHRRAVWVGFALVFCCPRPELAYSVQSHEQLIDLAWKPSIVPLLRKRFPSITEVQLVEAHAYAYGGCAIQDIGYYPFGNQFFSDLTHYVRTGDFVESLLRNARTPDELAFAIGALSHYVGDTVGHSIATNPAVAEEFPRLHAQYGPVVTYDESPHAHVRTEFAFDVDEISKRRFAPSAYLRHVGLRVSRDLLARAFYETYGLRITDVLGGKRRPTFRGYRFAVRSFLPRIAYAETVLHRKQMPADLPDAELSQLEKSLAQADFENGWDAYRKHPGIGTYTLAGLIVVLPKIGPLADLGIKVPDVSTQHWYVQSLNGSIATMRMDLAGLVSAGGTSAPTGLPNLNLLNVDLDTGLKVKPGSYRLTDETYAALLHRVTQPGLGKIPAGLKEDIEAFYSDPSAPIATKRNPGRWARVEAELVSLRSVPTTPEP
jgi:hypothetical protein